ncbi:unnamed protein product [Rotaria sp. Silwood1]|nr:unnamed protein product [Rotaria sp. Silwood1]
MEWQLDDLSIIKDIIKKLVSKVCRLDHERKRQLQIRKDKKRSWNSHSNETSTSKLPFMKIVNLTSGKLSTRLAQKGTKGPLHCVPSDVQDTVTALSRPVDKSMMVRLQLKRRLNESIIESMDVDTNKEENLLEETEISDKNRLKALALCDIENNTNSDEELDEDNKDIRTKYNIVAPAEKNKLSSLLTDKTIEALAFLHLFPDGRSPYDEEREISLKWKEYCKARLCSPDFREFAIKESYAFEQKAKLLRANPVLAARLFERRFTSLMNLFVTGGACCLGNVKDWFARIELQLRGSPHSYMPTWVEGAPKYYGP